MKVLIGTREISNFNSVLASEFKKQGHQVTNIANDIPAYHKNNYTLNPSNLFADYFIFRHFNAKLPSSNIVKRIIRFVIDYL